MKNHFIAAGVLLATATGSMAQKAEKVELVKNASGNKVDIRIGGKPFTSFLYPDTLEKPVLYPIYASNGTVVTRGFPINPKPGEPTDHPHHLGLWFNFENVNGLDFWNNSFAIPADKKKNYGWIKTNELLETSGGGTRGKLAYHANWVNQAGEVLLEEHTRMEFSGTAGQRIIDRVTTLSARQQVVFTDAKDGMLGLRLAQELQIPDKKDKVFKDDKGIETVVKASADISNGNYLTSEGKMGDAAWSTRARWCTVFGKMGADSISITIIDHPSNTNYPTYWHARGYGLFAANPLGEKIFTNGQSAKNLTLKEGETATFRYRVVINNGKKLPGKQALDAIADDFGKQ